MVSPSTFDLNGYSSEQIVKLYSLFVNAMHPILIEYGGKILKFQEDAIKSYFPKTSSKMILAGLKIF